MNTRFTIEEENIVAIYAEDSRETTLENILAAMPYMDEDMRQLAATAVNNSLFRKWWLLITVYPVFRSTLKTAIFPHFLSWYAWTIRKPFLRV